MFGAARAFYRAELWLDFGDEVMFVVDSANVASHIGLALRDAYSDEEQLSDVRVGIAHGPVLGREGDYFGPVLNRAALHAAAATLPHLRPRSPTAKSKATMSTR